MSERRLSPIQLAKLAKISPTTVYRALDLEGEFTPTFKTLEKIASQTGYSIPTGVAHDFGATDNGLPVQEIKQRQGVEQISTSDIGNMFVLTADQNRRAGLISYRVLDRALDFEGYLPGDIVIVDPELQPQAGDIVCAELDTKQANQNEILRRFEPPYLLSRSLDRTVEPAPILLDRSVHIKGTVTNLFRAMRATS